MKWTGPAAWARREARAGDRLPYARHLDEATVVLRDGSLMRTIRVAGMPFETEDAAQVDHLLAVRETMLRSVLDARFVVYHHVIRRRVGVGLGGEFPDPVSAGIDARWQGRLAGQRLFVNDQFLTIVRRPPRGKAGLIERLSRRKANREPDPRARRELEAASLSLLGALGAYGAELLQVEASGGTRVSRPLEPLSAIYNGAWASVAMPGDDADLGHYLPYSRVSFGLDALEVRGPGARNFAAMLSLKDYPDTTRAGITDGLLRLPCELVLTESFAPADRQIARERIDLALRRLRSADEQALAERAQMHAARDALGMGSIGFGDHHLSVMVRESDLDRLEGACSAVLGAFAELGAIAVREDVNLEPAFWAQFPGNEAYAVRRSLISTSNAAGFVSLHGFALGQPAGNHWGEAVTVFETTSATPYFFNFHRADLGNFTVVGPSGSGKTVVLNFLAAQARKFAPRMVFFDKDRGAEIFLRAIGAHYARLSPGEPTGFNPLALPDSPANRDFLRLLIACLTGAGGPSEEAVIADAIDAMFDQAPHLRRLRHLAELLAGGRRPEPGDLAARLAPWIGDGPHAWLFDHADDRLDMDSRVLGFDMTALLDLPVLRTPAMLYLFHRIDLALDGDPAMILIDEGWKALDDEVFAARIRDWLKTLRKRNALVGFATQSARDALDSRIASALVEQTATMIFTPNAKARPEDYCEGFGLSAHELDIIRALPAHSRCFLVRHANDSAVVRLDLSGMPEVLTLLSGREASVRRLDRLRAELGDDPARWLPALTSADWGFEPASADDWLREAAE
jgi:type IV secretion system protein VirB4